MLSLLQIRPGESRKALLLILLMLIPSAGSAISSPGIEALFFARVGVRFLPSMYVALGAVTLATSLIVTGLLGRIPKTLVLAASIGPWADLVRLGAGLFHHDLADSAAGRRRKGSAHSLPLGAPLLHSGSPARSETSLAVMRVLIHRLKESQGVGSS